MARGCVNLPPVTRWVSLSACIWVLSCAGASYTFAIYSPVLKSTMGYSQVQIGILAFAKDMGESFGIFAGLLSDRVPPWGMLLLAAGHGLVGYGGMWLVLSKRIPHLDFWKMGALLVIGAQGASYYHTVTLITGVRNFPLSRGTVVGALKGMVGLSAAIFTQVYTAFLAPNQASFLLLIAVMPTGTVLAFMGLVRSLDPHKQAEETEEEENAKWRRLMIILVALALYLLTAVLLQESFQLQSQVSMAFAAVMVAFLLLPIPATMSQAPTSSFIDPPSPAGPTTPLLPPGSAPLVPPHGSLEETDPAYLTSVKEEIIARFDTHTNIDNHIPTPPFHPSIQIAPPRYAANVHDELVSPQARSPPMSRSFASRAAPPALSPLHRIPSSKSGSFSDLDAASDCGSEGGDRAEKHHRKVQLLMAVGEGAVQPRGRRGGRPRRGEDFTLLQAVVKADYWLLFLAMTCGMGGGLVVINNLAQMGLSLGYENVHIFVTLVSVSQFMGRLWGGFASEYLVREYALPRPVVSILAHATMAVGHLFLAVSVPGSLYLGSVVVGFCHGVHWAIMPAVASELFGVKHFGMLYNTLTIANPLGSYLFSGLVAGYLYDMEAAKRGGVGAWVVGGWTSVGGLLSKIGWGGGGMAGVVGGKGVGAWRGREMLGMASTTVLENEKMANVMAGAVASAGENDDVVLECYGAHCFRMTCFIMMGVCLAGVILNVVLVYRTRRVYAMLYEKRLEARKASMEKITRSQSAGNVRGLESASSMTSLSRGKSVGNFRRLASMEDVR